MDASFHLGGAARSLLLLLVAWALGSCSEVACAPARSGARSGRAGQLEIRSSRDAAEAVRAFHSAASLDFAGPDVSLRTLRIASDLRVVHSITVRACPRLRGRDLQALVGYEGDWYGIGLWTFDALGEEAVAALLELPRLTTVRLLRSGVEDEDLSQLAQHEGIREIALFELPRVTDEGLLSLAALPELRTVNLWGCQGITQEGVERLRAALPHVTVND